MSRLKLIVVLAITAVLVVFVVQNAAAYEVRFLVWNLSISGAALVFVSAAAGFLAGLLFGGRVPLLGTKHNAAAKSHDS
ncbi:MAG: hypothetical protein GYA33_03010 [Thermogutta sp.]|nr:hypothetical protein [Thermogutta sp.]